MRTAIFLGLTAIADAIRHDWLSETLYGFFGIILLCFMAMDIVDFLDGKKN